MSPEDAAQQAVFVTGVGARGGAAERSGLGGLACVLLALVHLFLELLGLLLIDKAEAGHAVLELEGVEEGPVLVVAPRVEYLLIPYDTAHSGL